MPGGLAKRYVPRLRRQMTLATLRDDSASIDLIWYRAPGFLADRLANGPKSFGSRQGRAGDARAAAHRAPGF
mgnify:CR=1 FL=1